MMAWLPVQEIADWLLTFAIHSTLILAFAWLASVALGQRWLVWQERMLRFSLWAALASSTAQFVFATTPLPLSIPLDSAPVAVQLDAPATFELSAVANEPTVAASLAESWSMAGALTAIAALMALAGAVWLLRAHVRLRFALRTREPETDGRTLAIAAEVARELGMRQSPHVSRSQRILTPIAFGCFHPEICLPWRARSLATDELRAMLAHEVAHLRRRDPIWMWLAAGLHAAFPWQALLLAVRRRWSHLVELRCDAIAAGQTSPTAVARCLLDVAEWLKPPTTAPALALGMAARPSALRRRVEAALRGGEAGRSRRAWSMGFGGLSLSALTFVAPGVHSVDSAAADVAVFTTGADADFGSSPLRATLASLERERAEVELELAELRARVAAHPDAMTLEPLVAQAAQRLLAVERSCQELRALVDRRESETTPLKSR